MNIRDNNTSPSQSIRKGFKKNELQEIHAGTKYIGGVATKHYLKEELHTIMDKLGLGIINIKKLEYSWQTEFTNPPRWLKSPFPWDWFIIAKK